MGYPYSPLPRAAVGEVRAVAAHNIMSGYSASKEEATSAKTQRPPANCQWADSRTESRIAANSNFHSIKSFDNSSPFFSTT